jgi:hypothetical protein
MISRVYGYLAFFVFHLACFGLSDEQCVGAPAIPIIDISSLRGDDREEKVATAMKIGKACREIGFFVIINHGVDPLVAANLWNATSEFFDLPTDEKMKYTPISQAGTLDFCILYHFIRTEELVMTIIIYLSIRLSVRLQPDGW